MIKQTIFNYNEKEYIIKFPSVGEFIEIESMKLSFTKNRYEALSLSGTLNATFALDMADAVAYLSVLIPKLKEDLGVKGWWEMDLLMAKSLIKSYRDQFLPWFKPLMEDLYKYDEIVPDESTQEPE